MSRWGHHPRQATETGLKDPDLGAHIPPPAALRAPPSLPGRRGSLYTGQRPALPCPSHTAAHWHLSPHLLQPSSLPHRPCLEPSATSLVYRTPALPFEVVAQVADKQELMVLFTE